MTDYSPPNTFYSQTYGLFENQDMYKFIGKNGAHFKFLTTKLEVEYIWWNKETNIIEIWGPHHKLKFAKKVLDDKMDLYMKKKESTKLERCNAFTTEQLNNVMKFIDIV